MNTCTCTLSSSSMRTITASMEDKAYFCDVLAILPIMFSEQFGFTEYGRVALVQLTRSKVITVTLLKHVHSITSVILREVKYIPQINEYSQHMFFDSEMENMYIWEQGHSLADIDNWRRSTIVEQYAYSRVNYHENVEVHDNRHTVGSSLEFPPNYEESLECETVEVARPGTPEFNNLTGATSERCLYRIISNSEYELIINNRERLAREIGVILTGDREKTYVIDDDGNEESDKLYLWMTTIEAKIVETYRKATCGVMTDDEDDDERSCLQIMSTAEYQHLFKNADVMPAFYQSSPESEMRSVMISKRDRAALLKHRAVPRAHVSIVNIDSPYTLNGPTALRTVRKHLSVFEKANLMEEREAQSIRMGFVLENPIEYDEDKEGTWITVQEDQVINASRDERVVSTTLNI